MHVSNVSFQDTVRDAADRVCLHCGENEYACGQMTDKRCLGDSGIAGEQ